MAAPQAATIVARLDRLPSAPYLWRLVALLSIGGFFEIYDLILTGYVTPGLVRSGIFSPNEKGLFGLTDQASFASVTFAGLFVGTIALAFIADRFGRRSIFTFALVWYAIATAIMATQETRFGVFFWRFIAGVGVGVELVTIDSYLGELVPKQLRGRAFAINQAIQFTAVPIAAFLAWQLVPVDPFGIAGWRWVVVVPVLGAIVVWWVRLALPESPRWLADHGRLAEAEAVMAKIEAQVGASAGPTVEPTTPASVTAPAPDSAGFSEMWRAPYVQRVSMLAIFNIFQTIGFYGFGNWVPQLLASQGASFTKSLEYSFIIAIAFPLGPLICSVFADRIERKWQICLAALGTAAFGLLFATQSTALGLVVFGVLITTTNNLMSYAYHAYQAELFPTRIRARAVGFVYSFSRLSTVFTSFMIAFFLQNFGATGVFLFIAFAMLVVILAIGVFGPKTNNRPLEEISTV
jgi:putative MFS transporter